MYSCLSNQICWNARAVEHICWDYDGEIPLWEKSEKSENQMVYM